MTSTKWDEPAGATTPRGWLMRDGTCVGFYLDYGPEHYRSPHEYCQPGRECRDCQPGNILAVRYPNGPGEEPRTSRYVETIALAREYVSTGAVASPAAFAIYGERETTARYFNGAGYVVRHEMYPHTHFGTGGPVTRQGHAVLVGARQGTGDDGGFAWRRYARPDTEPTYVPLAA